MDAVSRHGTGSDDSVRGSAEVVPVQVPGGFGIDFPGLEERKLESLRAHGRMLRTFVRRPWRTGTVVPSSSGLARLMVEDMGLADAETVVELGAGTGVFTRLIAERVKPGALVLSFEIDPSLASQLEGRIPGVRIVNDSAENLASHLAACGRSDGRRHPLGPALGELLARAAGAAAARGRGRAQARVAASRPSRTCRPRTSRPGRRFRSLLEASFPRVVDDTHRLPQLPAGVRISMQGLTAARVRA